MSSCRTGQGLRFIAMAIVALYFLKGIGSYFSGYLMEDVGQRVVMDLRDRLYGHILRQSASFFARNTTGQLLSRVSNDVAQVQRAVSETAGDFARESLALVGYTVILFYIDCAPRDGVSHRRADHRVSARSAGAACPSHGPAEPGGTRGDVARRRGNVLRPSHREGVRRRRAGSRAGSAMRCGTSIARTCASCAPCRVMPPAMELLGGIGMAAALWYGSAADRRRTPHDQASSRRFSPPCS